jgi:integrase
MKPRLILFRRNGVFYCEDSETGKQTSFRTRDRAEAVSILNARNEGFRQPTLNLQIARAYLSASNPVTVQRTWQDVMDLISAKEKESSRTRYVRALKSKAFDRLRQKKVMETTAEDFIAVLGDGSVSIIHFLRRVHNMALSYGWLPLPVLAPKFWPRPHYKEKRAITLLEHQRILEAEQNPERHLFYALLWEIGASQTDAALLTVENIDWPTRTLSYHRRKTGELAQLAISSKLEAIVNQLPTEGALFPVISTQPANFRAAEFCRRIKLLGIKGVSLHSYRYAWAERAKTAGYPERFAQEALGHNSKAVHRAYAKRALVKIPSLEEYEQRANLPH